MLHKLSKAYTLTELSTTAFEKECYRQKITNICKVWDKVIGTYHNMTYAEHLQNECYKIVAIELTDNNNTAIYYGVML